MRRLLLLTLLLPSALPAAAIADAPSRPLFGFNDLALVRGEHSPSRVMDLFERANGEVHRVVIQWRVAEPQPGHWNWGRYDSIMATLRRAGARPLLTATSAPLWATEDSLLVCGFRPYSSCERPPAPSHLGAYAEFVRRLVERYPSAVGLEVANEPNYARQGWRPRADPGAYLQVLRVASRAAKAARREIPIISGGLLNTATDRSAGNLSAEQFLEDLYAAGARGTMDAIGIHPYSYPGDPRPANSPYHRMLSALRAIRTRAGDAGTPFWITETGYSTSTGEDGVTRAQQAERLGRLVSLALREPDVAVVIVHSLIDGGNKRWDLESNFGVADPDLAAKPALGAVAAAVPPRLAVAGLPRTVRCCCRRRVRRCPPRTLLRYTLSEDSAVSIVLKRRGARRYVLRRRGARGVNFVRVPTRIGRRRLTRGRYRLTARAVDAHSNRSPQVMGRLRLR